MTETDERAFIAHAAKAEEAAGDPDCTTGLPDLTRSMELWKKKDGIKARVRSVSADLHVGVNDGVRSDSGTETRGGAEARSADSDLQVRADDKGERLPQAQKGVSGVAGVGGTQQRLLDAATALYMAGRWECNDVPTARAAEMWAVLRDALGLPHGTATNAGVAALSALDPPSPNPTTRKD